ncbi:MAG: DUF3842 family protein [Spirochaetales bacterium]|nr:DUF3842 family protein [Spirochaetales bacterium]
MGITIVVIDGMGGGIGAEIVTRLREEFGADLGVVALGTNSTATEKMLRAGSNRGATGENALRCSINQGDIVLGPIGIALANGLMGEVTKEIAEIVMNARGRKILVPMHHPQVKIVGLENRTLSELIGEAVAEARRVIEEDR